MPVRKPDYEISAPWKYRYKLDRWTPELREMAALDSPAQMPAPITGRQGHVGQQRQVEPGACEPKDDGSGGEG